VIRIGTSGWTYRHWKGNFYPEGLSQRNWLEYYSENFSTVEINATFYHIPTVQTTRGWSERTPGTFRFSVKASRLITHVHRLEDCQDTVDWFFRSMEPMRKKTIAYLFQLPPSFCPDYQFLDDFLARLPGGNRCVLELRNPDCTTDALLNTLETHGVGFCIHDYSGRQSPLLITGDTVYLRFHGFQARYAGSYPHEVLGQWAERIGEWAAQGKDVLAYFNNDLDGSAVRNALSLRAMVDCAL